MVRKSSKERQIVKSIIKPPRRKRLIIPSLVLVMMGLPSSGKTSVADRIIREFPFFYYISGESATYALTGKDKCSSGEYREAYELIYDLLKEYAQQGKPIIFDATNLKFEFRQRLREALKGVAKVFVIYTTCSDTLALQRLQLRQPDHGNKYWIVSKCTPATFRAFKAALEPLRKSEAGIKVKTSSELDMSLLIRVIQQLIDESFT